MASQKRNTAQIDHDRREIARYYLRGRTQKEIANIINGDPERDYTLTRQMISYDLGKIREAWRESSLVDMNEAKQRELQKIDMLELEYWQAWEDSCENEETVRQEGAPTDGGIKTEKITKTVKGKTGDPRYLQGVERCIQQRIKIIGIEAPTKIAPTTPDGEQPYKSGITDAEFSRSIETLINAIGKGIHEPGSQAESDLVSGE